MLDDEAVTIVEFAGNAFAIIENSWRAAAAWTIASRFTGRGGSTIANLHMGNALQTYSEYGFGYAVEKGSHHQGLDLPGV